ncbi:MULTISPECIES: DUF488 family protein [unclassified Enterococcus]|uniref:DUF488 domain-containing protein n=1 Tax=unclassified Enterococcus TaxID=2608891 RepID=UPI0013E9F5DA|nr:MULTISPECIES: DUF488 family protein [unclassified Enterococcus]
MIKLKRVYLEPEPQDGFRILVDRIWPRGITKEQAHLDLWLKEAAPSPALRKEFGHVPDRFVLFAKKYQQELAEEEEKKAAVRQLISLYKKHPVLTFVYGARNEKQNQAVVLKSYVEQEAER